jgi:uncharacterized SAM-binding protein YcdF (DUF218 family)
MATWLKPVTEPLGMLWLALLALLAWRVYRRQWRRLFWPGGLAAVLFLFACTPLSPWLLASLERPYAGVDLAKVPPADAVVMLGGVLDPSPRDVFGFELNGAADRFVTAVEIVRRGKGRALLLGGSGPKPGEPGPSEAELLHRWLSAWGLTNAPVFLLGSCANTRDEALRTQALAKEHGWQRVIVVSSAWHLRRAEGVFRALDLPATCVGSDFEGSARLARPFRFRLSPSAVYLRLLDQYLHEQIGWGVYRLRGWAKP